MNCPACQKEIEEGQNLCKQCGFDLHKCSWVVIEKVFPPDDIIFESLIKSFGIPVRLIHESIGTVFGISSGPLAEVKIAVPELCAHDTKALLLAELQQDEKTTNE